MDLVAYDASLAAPLTGFYNELIAGVPHCFPVAPEDMATALDRVRDTWTMHRILVVPDGADLQGFAHYAVHRADEYYPEDTGFIVFLGYARGRRRAGQALLDAVESDLRKRGIASVRAFHQRYRYPFYGYNHCYLSNRLDHVEALLGFNGYKKNIGGEIFLDAPNYPPVEPIPVDMDFAVQLEWKEGPGKRPDLRTSAVQDDRIIGTCYSLSCAAFARDSSLEDWHFCDSLDVAEECQGRNLGRHLLERSLLELHGIGYRHAAISTDLRNYRAALFYGNYGYRVVDYTYGWNKELTV